MNTTPPPPVPPPPAPGQCVLCDEPLGPNDERCPSCGLFQQLGDDRPNPFTQSAMWVLIGSLAAIYIVVLFIVLAAR